MHLVNPFIFAKKEPNTFIGGVGGSYITSAADYAAITNLSESDIKNFQVDGLNNISFYAEYHNYLQLTSADLTYLIDNTWVSAVNSNINANVNMLYCSIPNFRTNYMPTARNFFSDASKLKKIDVKSWEYIYASSLLNNAKIKVLDLRSAISISANNNNNSNRFQNYVNAERIFIGKAIIDDMANAQIFAGSNPFFIGLKSNCKVYYNPVHGIGNQKAWNTISSVSVINIGDVITVNGLDYTCVVSSPTSTQFMYDSDGRTTRSRLTNTINADTRTGTYSKITAYYMFNVFLEVDTQGVGGNSVAITYSGTGSLVLNATNFVGGYGLLPFLQKMVDVYSCNLIEYDGSISVNTPTSLSFSNLTSNSIDINFTPPTPNANGTECYEVWIDDGTVYRKLFEYAEITASGDTLDLAEVVADTNGNGMSGLKIKIRTMDGQMNYSEFTDPITLPI